MLITGTFKDLDDNTITVVIYNRDKAGNNITIGDTDLDDVYFASDPVSIETQCDDTFTHVMKRSCTISLITKIYLGDYLFANNMRSIVVNVFKGEECIFAGYVTPNTYSQGYSNVYEQLDIQCIDVLSSMQYEYLCTVNNYKEEKSQLELEPFSYILKDVGIDRTDYIVNNYPLTTLGQEIWVETWFEKVENAYYAIETKVIKLNNDAAITTNETRRGRMLEITSRDGDLDDPDIVNGKKYYKRYIYVTINGNVEINTGDWFRGNLMPGPQIDHIDWRVIGVIRTNPDYYVTNEVATAYLDDGSSIPNYDTRYGDVSLPATMLRDTIENTMYSGNTEYFRYIPCVTYDNKKYFFEEDSIIAEAVNSHHIFVECSEDSFNPGAGTQTLIGLNLEGNYIIALDINDVTDLSMLFYGTDIIKMVTVRPYNYLDCGSMCANCTSLKYARIDTYSFADIDDMFKGCTKLSNIVLNVIETYTIGDEDDFEGVPSWAMIYVQDGLIDEYYAYPPYYNYTIEPLSEKNILPIEE